MVARRTGPPLAIASVERFAAVEHRHLAETGAALEDRERFLAAAGYVTADADLALENEIQPGSRFALPEDELSPFQRLLPAQLRHASELAIIEILKDRHTPQQLREDGHRASPVKSTTPKLPRYRNERERPIGFHRATRGPSFLACRATC